MAHRCCVIVVGGRRPCPPAGQSPCPSPDRPTAVNGATPAGELLRDVWSARSGPGRNTERERKMGKRQNVFIRTNKSQLAFARNYDTPALVVPRNNKASSEVNRMFVHAK